MNEDGLVKIGVVGLSGFGGKVREMLVTAAEDPHNRTQYAGIFAIDADQHVETLADLKRRGVRGFGSFDELLASDADVIWLPVPIHLHRPMTEAALAAGKHVMLEKPVAGCIDDHDAIAAAAQKSGNVLGIGFQDVYRPSILALKRRLVAGEFGAVRRATVWGSWPRVQSYYERNGWAGAISRNGAWVLDSPLNNAMAHYANAALYLLGSAVGDSSVIEEVEGTLHRCKPIENYDTVSVRATLAGGAALDVLFTHAGVEMRQLLLEIDTDRGTLVMPRGGQWTFRPDDGEAVDIESPDGDGRPQMVRALGSRVRGLEEPDVQFCTPSLARPHTLLVSAISEAAPIQDVPSKHVLRTAAGADGADVHIHVAGIERDMEEAARRRVLLHEVSDALSGATVGRRGGLETYTHFAGPAA